MITAAQIKKLHTLKKALAIQDEDYRAALGRFGVTSSKELTSDQAAHLLDAWEVLALQAGVWQLRPKSGNQKTAKGAASQAQLTMVRSLWSQVSRLRDSQARAAGLEAFVKRITKRDQLAWCTHRDIEKLVRALKAMGATVTTTRAVQGHTK